jgi:hypothetical protein
VHLSAAEALALVPAIPDTAHPRHQLGNDSAPLPVLVFPTRDQVDESLASFQTTEPRTIAAVQQLESRLLVEFDGTSHLTDGERVTALICCVFIAQV